MLKLPGSNLVRTSPVHPAVKGYPIYQTLHDIVRMLAFEHLTGSRPVYIPGSWDGFRLIPGQNAMSYVEKRYVNALHYHYYYSEINFYFYVFWILLQLCIILTHSRRSVYWVDDLLSRSRRIVYSVDDWQILLLYGTITLDLINRLLILF